MEHKKKILNGIEIDEGISDFIETLWANDIETFQCCQGGDIVNKHSFIDSINGPYKTTYVDRDGIIREKAHLIFAKKDFEKIKKFFPKNSKFIVGTQEKGENFFEFWLGSFDAVWISWILNND